MTSLERELSNNDIPSMYHVLIVNMVACIHRCVKYLNSIENLERRNVEAAGLIGTRSLIEGKSKHTEIEMENGAVKVETSVVQSLTTGKFRTCKTATIWIGEEFYDDIMIR